MAEKATADSTLEYFQRMYKGEELSPFTIFHGIGAKCDECGWKD